MITLVRKHKATMPKTIVDTKTLEDIGRVVEGAIYTNIMQQVQADGSPLKTNAPSTRERKRKLGRPVKSLIDEAHSFIQQRGGSFRSTVNATRGSVTVTATAKSVLHKKGPTPFQRLVIWVQEAGYLGWFGINRTARVAIQKLIRDAIKKAFAKESRHG